LFFNSLQNDTEKFVLTCFLLKGQKVIIRIALLIIEMFKDDVMKATAFDQIYSVIATYPQKMVDVKALSKKLKSKKMKVTNTMLNAYRARVSPSIIENLQENLTNS